ncbi:MAG: hypothetical protein FD165_475 [Gammaproteobacteria bacterium]|nr:MAG: hypothetical protein FD165_475 [Gammaproteobacteria bacterium]TND02263.1 MAG: hypothetical protein FD120_2427 [Gammaproteobacteria bacterium]
MEELFRFVLARPADRIDTKKDTVRVRPSGDYQAQLNEARVSGNPRVASSRIAAEFRAGGREIRSIDNLKYGELLSELSKQLRGVDDMPLDGLNKLVTKLFDVDAEQLVSNTSYTRDRQYLGDVIVTAAILGQDGAVVADHAARLLRVMAVIDAVAAGDGSLADHGKLADAMSATLLLPDSIFPIPLQREAGATASVGSAVMASGVTAFDSDALKQQRNALYTTYSMLTHISPDHVDVPKNQDISDSKAMEPSPASAMPPMVREMRSEPAGARAEAFSMSAAADGGMLRSVAAARVLLKPEVTAAFGATERTVLAQRNIDLTTVAVPMALDRLSVELADVEMKLFEATAAPLTVVSRLGSNYYVSEAFYPGYIESKPKAVPGTHGSVTPAGIGDLLVVKQFLKRYEGRELAHIENILRGEYKERMHRRSRTTEETFTVETEGKKEEERDQQTTERFELKTEASEVLKQDQSLKLGLTVTAKYGPMVEIKATADFAMNQSKEESKKVATSYSKDVTTRASSKVFERRREERILKTIEVFEEKNTHGIDNKAGADHVIGQYQWVDKVYEAQVFNYGKRLLFDIMIPEPAAFLLYATGSQPKVGAGLVKPSPFTLTPADISEWNYAHYVKLYQAAGVGPPPLPYTTASKALEGKGGEHEGSTKAFEVPLLDGYSAISGHVAVWYNRWGGGTVDVVVGKAMNRFSDNGGWAFPLSGETGLVAVALKTLKAEVYVASIELYCQRSDRLLMDWKLKTHTAILQAYQKLLRDYEDKLAALEVQAAQQIQGRNPLENERMIRAELKKSAISVFTAQHYDLFGAITTSVQGYPQANLPEAYAEGKYIRFFEQAFEWEQSMFFLYPYFWGRKGNWVNRSLLQDVDPLFADFIKAGAARVVLPVRPGFEKAVAHFMDTGQTWDGGDLPTITSPLYVSIIEEIRERDKAPGAEIPHGDPWDVHLPTTLLKLRDVATLPQWQKNPQGEWVPV